MQIIENLGAKTDIFSKYSNPVVIPYKIELADIKLCELLNELLK